MIWKFIVKRKCQQHLQLIERIHEGTYSVSDLAEKMSMSTKTITRYLADLQQRKIVKKERTWQLNWQTESAYLGPYRKLVMEDPLFQVFRKYLWDQGGKTTSYPVLKELNRQLLSLNLSVSRRSEGLIGGTSLILLLQFRFLRDFYSFEEQALYQQMAHYYVDHPVPLPNPDLFPENERMKSFIQQFELHTSFSEYFYFDYIRHNHGECLAFYQVHRKHRTELSQEVEVAIAIIEKWNIWKSDTTKEVFTVRLFDLFLGIHQGLPLRVFNLKWRTDLVVHPYYQLAKDLKRQLPLLMNCRIDELAFALKNILSHSYQSTLSLTPNLRTSLLIEEKCLGTDTSFDGN